MLGALLTGLAPTSAQAHPVPGPPYVDHVEWAKFGDLSSLRVYPKPAGRAASGLHTPAQDAQAWAEVLALAPDAAEPGMREQFDCHWQYAELGLPGKTSWNLEPWRPVVPYDQVVAANCNPGGTDEPF